MKISTTLILAAAALCLSTQLLAQAPQRINYQAAARAASGETLKDQAISVRLSLLDGGPTGPVVYQEAHSTSTNGLGLFQLPIGGGSVLSGSMNSVNWGAGEKFLRVEIDPNGGVNYVDMGISPLLSVPYALHAASGGTTYEAGAGILIQGNTIINTGDLNPNDDLLVTTIFGGDVSGTYDNLLIQPNTIGSAQLQNQSVQGVHIGPMGASQGQVLKWNGTTWAPGEDLTGGGGGSYNAGTGIQISGNTISALNENVLWNALQLYGRNISSTAPQMGQVLKWNGMLWEPADEAGGGGTYQAGTGISISGNIISAQANDPLWNAQRLQGRTVHDSNPTNGQALVWNAAQSRWEAQTLSGSGLGGNGTTNFIPRFTSANNLGNSNLYSGSSGIGFGTTSPSASIHIKGEADQTHLRIETASGQSNTNPALLLTNANGDEFARMHSDNIRNLFLGRNAGMANVAVPQSTGEFNTFIGSESGAANVTGNNNTGAGFSTLALTSSGNNNTALGSHVLMENVNGSFNTAVGAFNMQTNTTGEFNSSIGTNALNSNKTGSRNTALGASSLNGNNPGDGNSAVGFRSMFSNFSGRRNVAVGQDALFLSSVGNYNVAVGVSALYFNANRNHIVAVGDSALLSNSFGVLDPSQAIENTGIGSKALMENTIGSHNTAVGYEALRGSTVGSRNTALGAEALHNNFIGEDNTAIGYQALAGNNSGIANIALGPEALKTNTAGSRNIGIGYRSLSLNTEGAENTAIGHESLRSNISGEGNLAMGRSALMSNTIGNFNTALGTYALEFGSNSSGNTALGYEAGGDVVYGSNNTMIGFNAKASLSNYTNSTIVGANTAMTGSNQVRLGNAMVTSIGGFANWSNISDKRVKKEIRHDAPGLDFILALRPVTYELDRAKANQLLGTPYTPEEETPRHRARQSGFLAQDVDQLVRESGAAFQGVDVPEHEAGVYALRYAEFVVPLVKAVQEQQQLIEAQGDMIRQMQEELKALRNELGK
jgi:hypothetical protein